MDFDAVLGTTPASGRIVELISGDKVKAQAIEWLWTGYLAAGKLHIVAGAPGTGKTTLVLDLAATLTRGGVWPDGTGAPTGDVIDPIASAVAVAADSHKNTETRRALQPLVDFAERIGCALIGITHFTKGTQGREPLERVTGSLAFGAMPRIVLVTANLRDGGNGRVLVRAKSNIGPGGGGFRYEVRQEELPNESRGIFTSRVAWCGPVDGTAGTILADAENNPDADEKSEVQDAGDWLRTRIDDAGGQMESHAVIRKAAQAGFKKRTIHRARKAVGVITNVTGFGSEKRSMWKLPDPSIVPTVPDEIGGTDGTDGNFGMDDEPVDSQEPR